jgi:hypothetical protein
MGLVEYQPEYKEEYRLLSGEKVYGCSTVAGVDKPVVPLMSWAAHLAKQGKDFRTQTKDASGGGNVGHFIIECYLTKNIPSFVLNPPSEDEYIAGQIAFNKFKEEWEYGKFTLVKSEVQLVSETYKYGGKLDIVARDDQGTLVLIDIKTSKSIYGSHLVQLSGYENLWNDNNEEKIKRRAIFRHGRKEDRFDTETRWIAGEDIGLYFNKVFLPQLAVLNGKGELKAMGKLV